MQVVALCHAYCLIQPNSMGIDLRDVDEEFYLKVKELNMVSRNNAWYGALILE